MVTISYLDTSAAMKLVVQEVGSDQLENELMADAARRLVSSWLLHTELHCAAGRHADVVPAQAVNDLLDSVVLVDVSRGDLISAGTHAPLRSHDAVHLAVALRIGADEIITYDAELAEAALRAGLRVIAPA